MVEHARTCFRVSIRRACRAVPAPRSTRQHRSRRPGQAALGKRIREIAGTRPGFGYARIHVPLRREGRPVNRKRVHRLYRLEGPRMRHKPPRRVMAARPDERASAHGPNQVRAMAWIYDEPFDGRRLWVLTVVDVWSRFSPVPRVRRQARATDVVEALRQAVARQGGPRVIRADRGCRSTSKEPGLWAHSAGVTPDFSRRGKPTGNAFAEASDARPRAECLGRHRFLDLDDARSKVEAWRVDHNGVRPHGAIGGRPPVALISAPERPLRGDRRPESLA